MNEDSGSWTVIGVCMVAILCVLGVVCGFMTPDKQKTGPHGGGDVTFPKITYIDIEPENESVVVDIETCWNYSIRWCEDEWGNMIDCADLDCVVEVTKRPINVTTDARLNESDEVE